MLDTYALCSLLVTLACLVASLLQWSRCRRRGDAAVVQWLTENGSNVYHCVEARYSEADGTGLYATANIAAGTELLRIPGALCLSTVAPRTECDQEILQAIGSLVVGSPVLALAALLDFHRHNASPLQDYLGLLDVPPLPMLFFPQHEKLLCSTYLAGMVQGHRASVLEYYERVMAPVVEKLPHVFVEPERHTAQSFVIAMCWALSRSFEVAGGHRMFIPGADLLNHAAEAATSYVDDGSCIVVAAPRDFGTAEQVTINYKTTSSLETFLLYGYVGRSPLAEDHLLLVLATKKGRATACVYDDGAVHPRFVAHLAQHRGSSRQDAVGYLGSCVRLELAHREMETPNQAEGLEGQCTELASAMRTLVLALLQGMLPWCEEYQKSPVPSSTNGGILGDFLGMGPDDMQEEDMSGGSKFCGKGTFAFSSTSLCRSPSECGLQCCGGNTGETGACLDVVRL